MIPRTSAIPSAARSSSSVPENGLSARTMPMPAVGALSACIRATTVTPNGRFRFMPRLYRAYHTRSRPGAASEPTVLCCQRGIWRCDPDQEGAMRAWRAHELGKPHDVLRLEDVPEPEPGPGQLLVRVE